MAVLRDSTYDYNSSIEDTTGGEIQKIVALRQHEEYSGKSSTWWRLSSVRRAAGHKFLWRISTKAHGLKKCTGYIVRLFLESST